MAFVTTQVARIAVPHTCHRSSLNFPVCRRCSCLLGKTKCCSMTRCAFETLLSQPEPRFACTSARACSTTGRSLCRGLKKAGWHGPRSRTSRKNAQQESQTRNQLRSERRTDTDISTTANSHSQRSARSGRIPPAILLRGVNARAAPIDPEVCRSLAVMRQLSPD